ncbi:MAG: hydroxyisourate hydrolase [Rhodospirillaceae bacterium]
MSGKQGYLTTHVLDTARGLPAEGLSITLYRLRGDLRTQIRTMVTNSDGRTDSPILPVGEMDPGSYELEFSAGAYFDRVLGPSEAVRFLDVVPIRFGISDPDSHYHVPLLLAPYGYSTYRGS